MYQLSRLLAIIFLHFYILFVELASFKGRTWIINFFLSQNCSKFSRRVLQLLVSEQLVHRVIKLHVDLERNWNKILITESSSMVNWRFHNSVPKVSSSHFVTRSCPSENLESSIANVEPRNCVIHGLKILYRLKKFGARES